jgi:hypothetical protein
MKLLPRAACQQRLMRIFPKHAVPDPEVRGPQAAAAVFVARYVAWDGTQRPLRPTTVLWFCDVAAKHRGAASRKRWYAAAMRSQRAVGELIESWGGEHRPWYRDNSRESLRDEVFRGWRVFGAIDRDESGATNDNGPVWTLADDFVALFDPNLKGPALQRRITAWQKKHLGPVAATRMAVAQQLARAKHAVAVTLPTGGTRHLRPGGSSLILKGVIEQLAPALMKQPAVLAISESATKVDIVDAALLRHLRLQIQADRLLPDALLFDVHAGRFWFVEAVLTDGVITEARRKEFLSWAHARKIKPKSCGFVTAFASRNGTPVRRRLPALAADTLIWFLDEPDRLLRFERI